MRQARDEVLIVIDVQNDFCPGGALAVPEGDLVVPLVNRLMAGFAAVVLTQDWHPAGHLSFASSHPGAQPFETMEMPYGPQTLWPNHCIQGTAGAEFHPDLLLDRAELVIRKGFRPAIDSYSAFFENDRTTPTGLAGYLRERGFTRIACAGLATDFCVRFSAEDARRLEFEVTLIEDATKAIDLAGSRSASLTAMRDSGVAICRAETYLA